MVAYSFKQRFITPIELGLGILAEGSVEGAFPQTHTIRGFGKRRHARPGEIVQLYYGMRTRQCRLIGKARCIETPRIGIFPENGMIDIDSLKSPIPRMCKTAIYLDQFARSDGFDDWADMRKFWIDEHGPNKFEGVLIKWEPIR